MTKQEIDAVIDYVAEKLGVGPLGGFSAKMLSYYLENQEKIDLKNIVSDRKKAKIDLLDANIAKLQKQKDVIIKEDSAVQEAATVSSKGN